MPTRNLRMETYTGAKMDAASPGVAEAAGVDAVEPMTELPAVLKRLIAADRGAREMCGRSRSPLRPRRCWALPRPRWGWMRTPPRPRDVTSLTCRCGW